MVKNLERIMKGIGAFCLAASTIIPFNQAITPQVYAFDQQTEQEQAEKKKEKEIFEYVNLKKKKGTQEDKKPTAQSSSKNQKTANSQKVDYIIHPLEVIIGNEAPIYVKDNETIILPYSYDFKITPQVNNLGQRTEMLLRTSFANKIFNDQYQTDESGYLCDNEGHKIAFLDGRINLDDYGILEDEAIISEITYETPTQVFSTARINILRGEKPVVPTTPTPKPFVPIEQEKTCPSPTSAIEKERNKFITEKPGKNRTAKGNSLFELSGAYILENEDFIIENDPQRTGNGWSPEVILAGDDYQFFLSWLNYTYNDTLPVFGGTIKQAFSEINLGAKLRVFGPIILGAEYIHTDNKWVADSTPNWSPYMNRFKFDGFYGNAGLLIGKFSGSFLEGTVNYGFGTVKESVGMPGRFDVADYPISSQSQTELIYRLATRIDLNPLLIEGKLVSGSYDNKAKTLNGERSSVGLKAAVSLGLLSESLRNIYVGVMYHNLSIKDTNLEFNQTLWGPMITANLNLDKIR